MIQKFLSKYGLATHLALLAALPLALSPFLAAATLASVVLWLTALAAVWFFTEPSVRAGEHLSLARARVRNELVLDPVFWFLAFAVVFAAVRWANGGIALFYDAEQAAWTVKAPKWAILPSSVGDVGRLPFAVSAALLVVVCGIRHGIGLMARVNFGVVGALVAGLGGAAAAVCAGCGMAGFSEWMSAGFAEAPFWPSLFAVWLLVGVVSGVQAEARRWKAARLPFALGVAGNTAALLFFAPPLVAVAWLVLVAAVLVFSLFYLGRSGSTGAVARCLSLAVFGFALPVFMVMLLMPESARELKVAGLTPDLALGESYRDMAAALSRISRAMWTEHPWTGAGLGAFGLHAQFLAEKAEWAVLPAQPQFAASGFWTILAERGIVGCALPLVLLGMLLFTWGARLVGAFAYLRHKDDADIFPFAVPPVAWIAPFVLALQVAEALFAPITVEPCLLFALALPLALSAAAFPKARKPGTGSAADSANQEK
ncbi:MAG: hypothetical protein Q4E27_10105 [Bacteroidales bacterium]|nr:hypothetical protein [Bacteroidales bacterium]